MWVLFLEAGVALFLLVFIVWWTMFHGRSESIHDPKTREEDETVTKSNDSDSLK